MDTKLWYWLAGGIVGLGLLGTYVYYEGNTFGVFSSDNIPADSAENTACTLDAMICPDGSAVGRIPPSCDFAPCPVSPTSTGHDVKG